MRTSFLCFSVVMAAVLVAGPARRAVSETTDYGRYLELRVYTARPESRARFLCFFEEHFLESQAFF